MLSVELSNLKKALLVAGSSNSKKSSIKILMTYNGLVWKEVQSKEMKGYTSRAMEFHNGKVYVATVDEQGFKPYLYSSLNPEIYPWKTEIDSEIRGFDKGKNPTGSIYN